MSFRTETFTRTFCTECGKELKDATDWALCRRQHMLDRLASTPEGRRTLDMLLDAGFVNKPDPWMIKR